METKTINPILDYEDFLHRVIGPQSWFYNYMDKKPWEELAAKLDAAPTPEYKSMLIEAMLQKYLAEIDDGYRQEQKKNTFMDKNRQKEDERRQARIMKKLKELGLNGK